MVSLQHYYTKCSVYCTNSFSIWNDSLEAIAIGIYSDSALVNHSCEPNCWTAFNGRQLELRTLCPVKPGEPVTISYLTPPVSRLRRQRELKENYCFICVCERCSREKAAITTNTEKNDAAEVLVCNNHCHQFAHTRDNCVDRRLLLVLIKFDKAENKRLHSKCQEDLDVRQPYKNVLASTTERIGVDAAIPALAEGLALIVKEVEITKLPCNTILMETFFVAALPAVHPSHGIRETQ